jgi:gamma-glutamyl:cysteine ligase YbdK (ATP-grasp superfamily)
MYRMADQVVAIGNHVTIQLNSSILSLRPRVRRLVRRHHPHLSALPCSCAVPFMTWKAESATRSIGIPGLGPIAKVASGTGTA